MRGVSAIQQNMSLLFEIPDDVWCLVVEFSTYTVSQVLGLQLINAHFRRVMRNPIMISHVTVGLEHVQDVHRMGTLRPGVRHVKAAELPYRASLEFLSGLTAVRCLNLSQGQFDAYTLEMAIGSLVHLDTLDLSFCKRLVELKTLPATLRVLDVTLCSRLQALPALPNLERLHASNCQRLRVLPDFRALISINLGWGSTSFVPHNTLRYLKTDQTNVPDANSLTNLDSLCLVNCNFERQQWCCAPLSNLRELALVFVAYRKAHDLSCLALLKSLQTLHLEIGVSDANLVYLETLVNLKALSIGSEHISDNGLASITKMRSLETLHINNRGRTQITHQGLVALVPLVNLVSLRLSECHGVRYKMRGLSALVQLRTLSIEHNANFAAHWPVTPEEKMMDYMVHEDDLRPLTKLSNLTVLKLWYCHIMSLKWLNKIPRLEMLVVKGCPMVLDGLWDLMPCNIKSVVLGEDVRAKLGKDAERFRHSVLDGQLSFEI